MQHNAKFSQVLTVYQHLLLHPSNCVSWWDEGEGAYINLGKSKILNCDAQTNVQR